MRGCKCSKTVIHERLQTGRQPFMRGCTQQENPERLRTARQPFMRGCKYSKTVIHERLQTDTVDNYLWEAADRYSRQLLVGGCRQEDDRSWEIQEDRHSWNLHTPRQSFIWEADDRRQRLIKRLQIWGHPLIGGCRQKDKYSWEATNRRTDTHKRLRTKEQLFPRGCNLRFCEVLL